MTRTERLVASKLNYWAGIAIDVLASVTVATAGFVLGDSLLASLSAMLAATLYYSLWEYGLHRWIYHGERNVIATLHARHHADMALLIGAPFYFSLVIASSHAALLGALAGGPVGLVFGGTMLFCYAQQSLIHHAAHRYGAPDVLGMRSRLRRHHMIHHTVHAGNYGMSTALWDRVFGTLVHRARVPERSLHRDQIRHPEIGGGRE